MNIILIPLFDVLHTIIHLYTLILFVAIIVHWLIAFGVINTGNSFVDGLNRILTKLTEPVLRPIRQVLPDLGGIDISPIIVFLGLQLLNGVLVQLRLSLIY